MAIDPKVLRRRRKRIEAPPEKPTSQPSARDHRKGGGGVGVGFGVVRSIDSDANTVRVTPAVENTGTGDRMKLLDEKTMTMKTWPGLLAKHYAAFVWEGPPSGTETPYLPVFRIGNDFYVQQYLKFSVLSPAPNLSFSDCTPVGLV